MTVESELKKLTEAVTGLTAVLANAAISTPEATAVVDSGVKHPGEPKAAGAGAAGGPGAKVPGPAATTGAGAAGGPGAAAPGPAKTLPSVEVFPGEELYAEAANSSRDEIVARLTPLIQSHGQDIFSGALKAMGIEVRQEKHYWGVMGRGGRIDPHYHFSFSAFRNVP